MRYIFILAFIVQLNTLVTGQDLIVTNQNDSINCKITKEKDNTVYFTYSNEGEISNTLINISEIKYYQKTYYNVSELPKSYKPVSDFNKIRLSTHYGFSYQINKMPDGINNYMKDYIKELNSGYNRGVAFSYFIQEEWGLGLRYSQFYSSNSRSDIYVEDNNGIRNYGALKDDVRIYFLGPTFTGRLYDSQHKNVCILEGSLGYIDYLNNYTFVDTKYQQKGNSFAMIIGIGYEIELSKQLYICFMASYYASNMFKYTIDDGTEVTTFELDEESYISLSRFDLSLSLSFMK